ncbi:MAG TPA: 50S ribosomal protein L10 [Alphaproteobacteria bacterium]|nr:50S ribosomal protein L10 [Alphaproteobacteria bacterium]
MTTKEHSTEHKAEHKKGRAEVSQVKKKAVQDLKETIEHYPVIAIINLENLPARSLQKMKTKLRKDLEIKVAKKSIIENALKLSTKKDIDKLLPHLVGSPALLLSKENPFRIYKLLKQSKSAAAIKPGQITPKDLMIPAGPTPFAPGPIIGELGMLRIKAGIEAGKVVIKEDAHVAKKGDVVNDKLSALLMRLGIEPMEIGLNLVAAYENGNVLVGDVLDIDDKAFIAKIQQAASEALNLAVDIAYPSKDTITLLIQKTFRDSKAIAIETDILADLVVEQILAKASAQADAVSNIVNKE